MNLTELYSPMQPAAYRPNDNERSVIAKIVVSQTPQLAHDQVSRGLKSNAAKNKLIDLGFITFIDGEVGLTDDGEELAKAQALMDDMGEATEQATELAAQE